MHYYFISEYMIFHNIFHVFQEFLFALQIIRCQYQEHDYAHLQWDFFISTSAKPYIDTFFILTTGISRQWWNDNIRIGFEMRNDSRVVEYLKLCSTRISTDEDAAETIRRII